MEIIIEDGGKYCVQWECKKNIDIVDGRMVMINPPVIETQTLYSADTKEDALDYINRCLDEKFRYAYLDLSKTGINREADPVYSPISKDIVEMIKKDLVSPMKRICDELVHQYKYMSLEDQESYRTKYLEMYLSRLWEIFCTYKNQRDSIHKGNQTIKLYWFSNENIEVYKDSHYYEKYKNKLSNLIKKLMDYYVREPIVVQESIPPQNASEAINNLCNNIANRKKKTAPTLTDGWICYIVIMLFEIVFPGTVALWVPTTIIFLVWSRKEIKKYNGGMTQEEKDKIDLWKEKY